MSRKRGARHFATPGRRRYRLLLGLSLVVAVVAVAVIVAKQRAHQGPKASAVPTRTVGQVGQGAPSARLAKGFSLQTIDGKTFSLAAARRKVVVVDFLAPGCPSCAEDLAGLRVAAKRFAPGGVKVVIVDVSGANDSKALRDYYRGEYDVPEAILIGEDRGFRIARSYGVNELGMSFVIGRDGRIRWQGVWGGDEGTLFPAIEGASAQ